MSTNSDNSWPQSLQQNSYPDDCRKDISCERVPMDPFKARNRVLPRTPPCAGHLVHMPNSSPDLDTHRDVLSIEVPGSNTAPPRSWSRIELPSPFHPHVGTPPTPLSVNLVQAELIDVLQP